jgi:lactaldehyde reductase
VAHAILLAPAMRLLLSALGEGRHLVAHALGVAEDGQDARAAGEAAAEAVAALLAATPLPKRLAEAGVPEPDLPAIAVAALADHMVAYCPRPVGQDEILALVRAAW